MIEDTQERKRPIPISTFQKQCQMYCSSVSARGCTYLYINLPGREHELVLSNATPDLLATCSYRSMISIHRILPKDDFMSQFRKYFFSGGNDSIPYIIKTEFITKSFKDNRVESVLSYVSPERILYILGGGKHITLQTTDEENEFEDDAEDTWDFKGELEQLLEDDGWDTEVRRAIFGDSKGAGIPMEDPYILNRLEEILTGMEDDVDYCQMQIEKAKTTECESSVLAFDHEHLLAATKVHSNWYRSLSYNGTILVPDSPKEYRNQRILLVDGLDTPSIREFLKKRYIKTRFDGVFALYIYVRGSYNAQHLAWYDAATVTIQSTRPYMSTLLVPYQEDHTYRHIKPREVYSEP